MSGYGFTNAGTTYDDEDRLTGYQRTNGALSQSWNLTSVGDWNSVTTSGIGFQPVVQNRTHGPTHELLTAGGQTVNTDVKGNITLLPAVLTSSLKPQASSLQWDFDNKLKSVDVGNNSSTDVEYKYDALGRRVARVGSSGSYVYVQSDQQTIADYGVGDAPSSPLYRYVYASYIDEPVVRKGAGTGGTIHYYHRNQQYSITAITTSSGNVAELYAYSAYGEPTICDGSGSVIASSAINNRYSYTGREWDATVGLYHFRARWMSPKTGRFLTKDPIGYEGGISMYSWVLGRSLDSLDPSGLQRGGGNTGGGVRPGGGYAPGWTPGFAPGTSPNYPPPQPRPNTFPRYRPFPQSPSPSPNPTWIPGHGPAQPLGPFFPTINPGIPGYMPPIGLTPVVQPPVKPEIYDPNKPQLPWTTPAVSPQQTRCQKCLMNALDNYNACVGLTGLQLIDCQKGALAEANACESVCGKDPPGSPPGGGDENNCWCCEYQTAFDKTCAGAPKNCRLENSGSCWEGHPFQKCCHPDARDTDNKPCDDDPNNPRPEELK